MCPNVPNAICTDNYCGGCNAVWILEREDVTERCCKCHRDALMVPDHKAKEVMSLLCMCYNTVDNSSDEYKAKYSPVCPAVEIDTCSEDCATDDNCGDMERCCAGCGHTCRPSINLPYYDIPLVCPPRFALLASDSATCDMGCQSDLDCPGSKICCRSGCSSSCQNGILPPQPCNYVREQLDNRERDDRNIEDQRLGQYVPSCLNEGWFSPVQTWENNLWCVNVETGRPIGNAYTAGSNLSFSCPSELNVFLLQ